MSTLKNKMVLFDILMLVWNQELPSLFQYLTYINHIALNQIKLLLIMLSPSWFEFGLILAQSMFTIIWCIILMTIRRHLLDNLDDKPSHETARAHEKKISFPYCFLILTHQPVLFLVHCTDWPLYSKPF